jgi:CDGSH-type Zn-finger protein
MTEPIIADTKPQVMTLSPGKYYWCSCGASKNQPFCDGSHQGTDFTPQLFEVTEEKNVALCLCKHTKNSPFCDGTHTNL